MEVFANQANEKTINFAEARDKLVAVVRERALFEHAKTIWSTEQGTPVTHAFAHEPLTAWFAKCVAVDFPGHLSIVMGSQLETWGRTFDEVYSLGLTRLRECSPPLFRQEDGVFISTWKDDYDSSRILVPELFHDLHLNGDPVVALPNRLSLLHRIQHPAAARGAGVYVRLAGGN